jgi:hypothetical protein
VELVGSLWLGTLEFSPIFTEQKLHFSSLFQKREATLFSPGTPPQQPLVKTQQPVS